MKSNTRKKILALFATSALASAGAVAWAALANDGVLFNTLISESNTLVPASAYDPVVGADAPVTLASPTITLAGNLALPTVANLVAAGSGITAYNSVATATDAGGAITLAEGEVLNIQPAYSATYTTNKVQGAGSVLRLDGEGVTNAYAARGNNPDSTDYNTYSGGTYIQSGRLNVAHSNALGVGPITLANDTTFGVIGTTNIDIGNTDPNGAPIPAQIITVRRHDDTTSVEDTRPVTFDVPTVASLDTALRVYRGIVQDPSAATPGPVDYDEVQIVKTGSGTMVIDSPGSLHTGGTLIEGGTLFADGGITNKYAGELGDTWNATDEADSAKYNYNAAFGAGPKYIAHATTGVNDVNQLTINAPGRLRINRDQFFGDLNGNGTFQVDSWAKNSVEIIPQVTMQLNETTPEDGGRNADFTGNITGKVNLVLDNPVAITGANDNYPRIQALTGSNTITLGDTFIKDGTLSLPGADRIGPGTLRIGMHRGGFEHNTRGVAAGTDSFRGFDETQTVATFHGSETFTVNQKTIVYAHSTPVHDYDNGTGRYDFDTAFVNIAASRGKTVSFPDVNLVAEHGAVATIVQVANENPVRYAMEHALSINDKLDENTSWDGTVALTASYDMVGTNASNKFGFDVKNGVLHLETTEISGYALVGIRQGATLSLGNTAREFDTDMTVVIEDDARVRVRPQVSDLATSLSAAQQMTAVFMADEINYTGLGMGTEDKRLVVQLDLTNVDNAITDQWIKVVGSHNAPNWNNIHYYPESASGQNEHLYKVKVARPDGTVFHDYSVEAYCDENEYNIYVHVKKLDNPGPITSENWTITNSVATNAQISGTAKLQAKSGDVYVPVTSEDATIYLFHSGVDTSVNGNAIDSATAVTDANGNVTYNFSKGGYGVNTTYVLKAVASGYEDKTINVTTAGGSGSSSGCDAGFGAFALLAAAGGAVVLRKKD